MHHSWYAHTKTDEHGQILPDSAWQPLADHLQNVAELAAAFARPFGGERLAHLAGLWHDVGKFSDAFQDYLRAAQLGDYHSAEVRGKIDHTSAGAQHSVSSVEVLGHLLAYAIAGHHAGLLDAIKEGASLDGRLRKKIEPWAHGLAALPTAECPEPPAILRSALARRGTDPDGAAFSCAFFVRMVFSCLVDADFLDTEAFVDPARTRNRPTWPADILERLQSTLDDHLGRFGQPRSRVDVERAKVLAACRAAANGTPGLFSLTVPTGGGKTLSSLAFALAHARAHGLRRVVYVAPFTSIIEQNADVFRKVFEPLSAAGVPDPVIEHHSALDVGSETFESRLASENWDAPLVVTTSVQLYESLFASRSSRCRKLHNLARAVIILDEAQKLPVDFLKPCLFALRELAASYGTTVVLCTATQPAIHRRPDFVIGLDGVREIVPDPTGLHLALKRVEVTNLGQLGDDDVISRVLDERQALCIVNTRRHARLLFDGVRDHPGVIHLSAAMCPQHRTEVLTLVRQRLHAGEPCRVISTQLVEAGVDLDFPVVFRSMAGLDSIAQAAGRCNRNGKVTLGRTFVFQSEHGQSEAFLRDTTNAATQILGTSGSQPLYPDLLSLEAVEHYFRQYYWAQQARWDYRQIVPEFTLVNHREMPFLFNFRRVADRFKLIDDSGAAVITPWRERGAELCDELRNPWTRPSLSLLRELQRYTVQAPRRAWQRAIGRTLDLVHDRYALLITPDLHYDQHVGLLLDREQLDADSLIT